MEIAALPSCEKSLFAGAKVAFFLIPRVTIELEKYGVEEADLAVM